MEPRLHGAAHVTTASAQGERPYQEDRCVSQWITSPAGSGWLLAVFDGHGGAATAEEACSSLVHLFTQHFDEQKGNAADALKKVCLSLQNKTRSQQPGSTASIVFIPTDADMVTLAVLGDSPVAILNAKDQILLGPDHNIRTSHKERLAAEARGGVYRAGYLEDPEVTDCGLQMTRSLGDASLSRVLDRDPEIEVHALGGKGIVIVGSDGLLQSLDSQAGQIERLLKLVQQGADAENLVQDALSRRTGDNVTAIVWKKI